MSNQENISFTTSLEVAIDLGIFDPYDFDLEDIPNDDESED